MIDGYSILLACQRRLQVINRLWLFLYRYNLLEILAVHVSITMLELQRCRIAVVLEVSLVLAYEVNRLFLCITPL